MSAVDASAWSIPGIGKVRAPVFAALGLGGLPSTGLTFRLELGVKWEVGSRARE